MTKCNEIIENMSAYIDNELGSEECARMEKHLQNCDECVAFINTLKKTVEVFKTSWWAKQKDTIPPTTSANLRKFLSANLKQD